MGERRARESHLALELCASFALGAAGTAIVLYSDALLGDDARPSVRGIVSRA